ncbi:MAG: hypothetical protein GY765_26135, partial [bacterium]|nr:hypothetical protein [bacterium]
MIQHFKQIGHGLLKPTGNQPPPSLTDKRTRLLSFHTLKPIVRKNGITRAVALDFNLETNSFQFQLDK